ncbi:unnamed protein product [Lactuca virosa]|uniref:Reverse transcriptase/retrotransposon-derived protein RNase H-like domain-containing protein n=1 Tax=Lactuca virosa TaxID=75947 RepID=A0AAU9MAX2_9ASTR|nr:unnamed protein product [Lactuca virosa]
MQLNKGLKKGEMTYLAMLKEETIPPNEEIPKKVKEVLEEFKDVMSPELPKKLPPRRELDHEIKLELEAKPPANEWTEKCQMTFDDLKKVVMKEPILKLPDYAKPFHVQTDASDFEIGGVLLQDDHPVAYESWKLNDIGRR